MSEKPYIIVFGNEKGGSGKSTAAIHVAIGLLLQGYQVGTIDLDVRQGTLGRYLENRRRTATSGDYPNLPVPQHIPVERGTEAEESERLNAAIAELSQTCTHIVIDTPGTDNTLSRLGHSLADTLVTPMNDSFIDLDLLAKLNQDTHEIIAPSTYSEMVWDRRKQRALRDRGSIDWVVMRNRLSHLDARNKRDIADVMEKLSRRIGFRLAGGFGERVIFRELFLKGLTLLDPRKGGLTMSQIAARQEVRSLIDTILQGRKASAKSNAA
jgi:chromosome partitioning protein